MKKHLSTLRPAESTHLQMKLMVGAIVVALIPTIGVLVWGIAKAVKSPELKASDWTRQPAPIPPDDQQ